MKATNVNQYGEEQKKKKKYQGISQTTEPNNQNKKSYNLLSILNKIDDKV